MTIRFRVSPTARRSATARSSGAPQATSTALGRRIAGFGAIQPGLRAPPGVCRRAPDRPTSRRRRAAGGPELIGFPHSPAPGRMVAAGAGRHRPKKWRIMAPNCPARPPPMPGAGAPPPAIAPRRSRLGPIVIHAEDPCRGTSPAPRRQGPWSRSFSILAPSPVAAAAQTRHVQPGDVQVSPPERYALAAGRRSVRAGRRRCRLVSSRVGVVPSPSGQAWAEKNRCAFRIRRLSAQGWPGYSPPGPIRAALTHGVPPTSTPNWRSQPRGGMAIQNRPGFRAGRPLWRPFQPSGADVGRPAKCNPSQRARRR